MSYTQDQQSNLEKRQQTTKGYKNITIGVLAVALIGLSGYLVVNKSKSNKVIAQQETQIEQVSNEKSELQMSFDESLIRLDSMETMTADLSTKLEERNSEIAKTKTQIRSILNKRNATTEELSRAKELIASLNVKITDMQMVVAQLTQDNQVLTQEKTVLIQEKEQLNVDLTAMTVVKEELTAKVDIASTLNASNIAITPVNVKKNDKEKITTTAKKVDKLMISFDVNNRIAQSGTTDVYVCVLDPDGKLISTDELGSGMFTTREEGDKLFTTKVPVEVETAKKKLVEFSFTPAADFKQGNYTIQIYQNGFIIGEGTRTLKKGGLFS